VHDLIGARRIDVAAEGRLVLVRHGEHRQQTRILTPIWESSDASGTLEERLQRDRLGEPMEIIGDRLPQLTVKVEGGG
jgi:hypothetical protein